MRDRFGRSNGTIGDGVWPTIGIYVERTIKLRATYDVNQDGRLWHIREACFLYNGKGNNKRFRATCQAFAWFIFCFLFFFYFSPPIDSISNNNRNVEKRSKRRSFSPVRSGRRKTVARLTRIEFTRPICLRVALKRTVTHACVNFFLRTLVNRFEGK